MSIKNLKSHTCGILYLWKLGIVPNYVILIFIPSILISPTIITDAFFVIGGSIPQKKGKSRILTLENGAQIEYMNVDSDADWETDSDPDDDVELLCTKRLAQNNNKNMSTANRDCKSTGKKKSRKACNFKLRESVKCKKCDAKIVFFSTQSLQNHINCLYVFLSGN